MAAARISFILRTITLLITIISLSFPAYAQYGGGSGEPNDPYRIATAGDLMLLGESTEDYDKHFILTADIDLDPNLPGRKVFDKAVIGSGYLEAMGNESFVFQGTPFTGVFDGGGHRISHLTITGNRYLGLFGKMEAGAEVKDLGVVDVNVTSQLLTKEKLPGNYVGALVGYNAGSLIRCYSTGMVGGSANIGGLVGTNEGTLTHSYSTSTVSASWVSWSFFGGLVGRNDGYVANCYSAGMVTGNGAFGGLVGGGSSWNVIHCVWDVEMSQQSQSNGGIGLSTDEMMDPYMLGLNGFANDPNWVLDNGRNYPRLAWEGTAGRTITEPDIDWLEGNGTPENPYLIETAEQLIQLGKASILWNKHYVLSADVDMDPALPGRSTFMQAPIQIFDGVFDGNGKTILNLSQNIFVIISASGLIKDLCLMDPNCDSSPIVRNYGTITNCYVQSGCVSRAGLVDYNVGSVIGCYNIDTVCHGGGLVWHNDGSVIQCYSTAIVNGSGGLVAQNSGRIDASYSTGSVSGSSGVGGLVGTNFGSLSGCYSTGSVIGNERIGGLVGINVGDMTACYSSNTVNGADDHVGGLVGYNTSGGNIIGCCSSGAVTGRSEVGGLVGGNYANVSYCYTTCAVSGSEWPVGGLVGYIQEGSVSQCYSAGAVSGNTYAGGLVGYYYSASVLSEPILTDCFWDIETSGQTDSYGGTGKTTAEMQTPGTFLEAGWDFAGETANGTDDIWWIDESQDYPRLWWEAND